MDYLIKIKQHWKVLALSMAIGIFAVLIAQLTQLPILDPLLAALIFGIIIRSFFKLNESFLKGLKTAPSLLIPIGAVFYGAANLNFAKFASVDINFLFSLLFVVTIYIIAALLLSHVFGLNEKTGYLIATGSAICGASAIAITSESIEAEPDDVSLSLISVFISALIGLFVILPLAASFRGINNIEYGVFSGTVLQFTGFVKASAAGFPAEIKNVALSVKAVRYVGLLFLIPLFSSLTKGKLHIPWFLWAFLGVGIVFSFMPSLAQALRPACKLILTILWSIAMASIGLNADIKSVLSRKGLKAIIVSFLSFVIAAGVFIITL